MCAIVSQWIRSHIYWVYDKDRVRLIEKVRFFIDFYEAERARWREEGRPRDVGDWVRRDIAVSAADGFQRP
jgi:hypothetical protein